MRLDWESEAERVYDDQWHETGTRVKISCAGVHLFTWEGDIVFYATSEREWEQEATEQGVREFYKYLAGALRP